MSIATDEAEKKYPRDVALTATSENNTCRRTGYIAGRTAEPTEAEIDAASKSVWEEESPTPWAMAEESRKVAFRVCMRTALLTSRKAVTE